MHDDVKERMKGALESAIEKGDEEAAANIIKILYTCAPDFLNWDINNGQNVLIYALLKNRRKLVKKLLAESYDINLIIQEDYNKRNFIWHAFNLDEQEIIKPIVNLLCQENQYELLLKGDINNNTLLHCAAKYDSSLLPYLLNRIPNENLRNLINQSNTTGDTPLHWATEHHSFQAVLLLINHGANLLMINNGGKSAARLLLELSQNDSSTFLQILNKINQDAKSILIKQFRQELIDHPSDTQLRNYFKANGLSSLQLLLLAHHEFNPNIPLRDHYKQCRLKQTIQKTNGLYQTNYAKQTEEIEYHLEDDILEKMPLYAERLGFLIFRELENAAVSEVDLLNNDKMNLLHLIDILDNLLQQIHQVNHAPPRLSAEDIINTLRIGMLFTLLLGLSGVIFNWESVESYILPAGFIGMISLTSIIYCWDKLQTPKLSQKLLDELFSSLNETLNKLEALSEERRSNLIALSEFESLKQRCRPLRSNGSSEEVTPIVNETKNHVSSLLKNLNRTQQPFSLKFFQPHVHNNKSNEHIINMNEEEQPLLRHAVS